MRHLRPSVSSRLPRLAAIAGAAMISMTAATASAAQPAVPPAPGPAHTTEVATPNGDTVVVVNTTTTSTPAPAPAPVAVAVAAPAPVPVVAPAPAPVANSTDVPPPPVPRPSRHEQALAEKKSEKGKAMGLAIGGWAMFGSTYFVSALIGTVTLDTTTEPHMRRFGRWMTLPVAGPFGAAFNARSATGTLFTTTLGLAQAAGFTMAVIGTARHRRAKRDLRLMAMPTRNGGQFGMSMRF